ncbi:hypothetical protein [Actinomyces urogenitalis]|uniref:hypothetical protein n=1 Tax=Actinomyces urogenitalis TaxID=103621 RepID=UPI00066033E4|nr:hypothetical protein [Actinomyces urogenitalis]MDU7428527.1 hypothetical protein [Actinomyces urogenitalis]
MWTAPISITLTRDLTLDGVSSKSFARSTRQSDSDLMPLLRGAYVNRQEFKALDLSQRHLTRLCALRLVGRLSGEAAIARESAAVIHGLPLIGKLPERVQLVRRGRTGGKTTAATRTLPAPEDCDMVEIDGIRVTSVAQTLIDLGRRRPFASNLTSLDAALRRGNVTKEQLLSLVDAHPHTSGNTRLRRWIEVADPHSESPGESLSRAVMIEHHLPLPRLQDEIWDPRGRLVGRVDFIWPDLGVIGEFDGNVKYGREMAGRPIEEVIQDERRREIAVERASGMRVVRWLWRDAWQGEPLLQILADVGVRCTH